MSNPSLNLFTIHFPKPTYIDLLFHRLPDEEQEQTERYKKDKQVAQIHGQNFE